MGPGWKNGETLLIVNHTTKTMNNYHHQRQKCLERFARNHPSHEKWGKHFEMNMMKKLVCELFW